MMGRLDLFAHHSLCPACALRCCCAHDCAFTVGPPPRIGKSACCSGPCGKRLSGKRTVVTPTGSVCITCYNPQHPPKLAAPIAVAAMAASPAASAPSAALPAKQSLKRRAESDPGELAALQTRSHSTAAALLDLAAVQEAHASPDSPTSFQTIVAAEQAELAARTPAQWARRRYLMSVAPRCERCNFPRTGRKGWDKNTGCHTDKNCNLYRWRVIDAFC